MRFGEPWCDRTSPQRPAWASARLPAAWGAGGLPELGQEGEALAAVVVRWSFPWVPAPVPRILPAPRSGELGGTSQTVSGGGGKRTPAALGRAAEVSPPGAAETSVPRCAARYSAGVSPGGVTWGERSALHRTGISIAGGFFLSQGCPGAKCYCRGCVPPRLVLRGQSCPAHPRGEQLILFVGGCELIRSPPILCPSVCLHLTLPRWWVLSGSFILP